MTDAATSQDLLESEDTSSNPSNNTVDADAAPLNAVDSMQEERADQPGDLAAAAEPAAEAVRVPSAADSSPLCAFVLIQCASCRIANEVAIPIGSERTFVVQCHECRERNELTIDTNDANPHCCQGPPRVECSAAATAATTATFGSSAAQEAQGPSNGIGRRRKRCRTARRLAVDCRGSQGWSLPPASRKAKRGRRRRRRRQTQLRQRRRRRTPSPTANRPKLRRQQRPSRRRPRPRSHPSPKGKSSAAQASVGAHGGGGSGAPPPQRRPRPCAWRR